jgi:hypothetical protein
MAKENDVLTAYDPNYTSCFMNSEDTKELFWGDRLLTDGIRVIPTYEDLPSCDKAADGVVYYITETRNGYTIAPDRTGWLQTIYAPLRKGESVQEGEEDNTVTTVGAVNALVKGIYDYIDECIAEIDVGTSDDGVKTISIGSVAFTEVDGVFTLDIACARDALGFKVPEGLEREQIELVTKNDIENLARISYVSEHITEITENLETFITVEEAAEIVTTQVDTVVTEKIAAQVQEVIQDKISSGEIVASAEYITYDTFD